MQSCQREEVACWPVVSIRACWEGSAGMQITCKALGSIQSAVVCSQLLCCAVLCLTHWV